MSNSETQKRRRAERAREFLGQLIDRYPSCFSRTPEGIKPLAIGILERISADIAQDPEWSDTPKWLLRQALGVYTRQSPYLRAVASGEPRVNLDGSVAEPTNDQARQHAQQLLDARKPKPAPKRNGKGRNGQRGKARSGSPRPKGEAKGPRKGGGKEGAKPARSGKPKAESGEPSRSKLEQLQEKFNHG